MIEDTRIELEKINVTLEFRIIIFSDHCDFCKTSMVQERLYRLLTPVKDHEFKICYRCIRELSPVLNEWKEKIKGCHKNSEDE